MIKYSIFPELLREFGEAVMINGHSLEGIVTGKAEAIRKMAKRNPNPYDEDFESNVDRFSYRLELSEDDVNNNGINKSDLVTMRGVDFQILNMNNTNQGTYYLFLMEA